MYNAHRYSSMSTSSSGSLNSLRSESFPSPFGFALDAPAYPMDFGPLLPGCSRDDAGEGGDALTSRVRDRSIRIDCGPGGCIGSAALGSSDRARL